MRVIIAQGQRKRLIQGPFGICASREDFASIRDQIETWLTDPGNGHGIAYGWLTIQESVFVMGPPETVPEPWDDGLP